MPISRDSYFYLEDAFTKNNVIGSSVIQKTENGKIKNLKKKFKIYSLQLIIDHRTASYICYKEVVAVHPIVYLLSLK